MSLGIRLRVSLPGAARPTTPAVAAVVDGIMYDVLDLARERIQAQWPWRTGRSLRAWALVQLGPMQYAFVNSVNYSRFVHYAGTPRSQTLAGVDENGKVKDQNALVPREIRRGMAELKQEFALLAASGRTVTRAPTTSGGRRRGSVSTALQDQIRTAILRSIASRGLRRAIQRRSIRAAAASAA